MSSDLHEEFAALRALGLLAQPELQTFEAELRADAELARLSHSLENTVTQLALAAPQLQPPPGLKQRVLGAVPEPDQQPAEGHSLGRFAPWALAAALALTAAGLAFQNLGLRQENGVLQTELRLAEVASRTAQGQLAERSLLAEGMINKLGANLRRSEDLARLKVSALASLAGNTKEAQAIAVWDPEQQTGLLTIDQLPATEAEKDYQIWVVDPAYQNPVNGGVFHVTTTGRSSLAFRPDQPVKQAAAFAISLEKKGGVPKAEGPIVLLGKL
jgi:anti-sigma-K factor RskA